MAKAKKPSKKAVKPKTKTVKPKPKPLHDAVLDVTNLRDLNFYLMAELIKSGGYRLDHKIQSKLEQLHKENEREDGTD